MCLALDLVAQALAIALAVGLSLVGVAALSVGSAGALHFVLILKLVLNIIHGRSNIIMVYRCHLF